MATIRVLLDTTVLIDLLHRRPRAVARLRTLADQGARLAISMLSVAEIYAGMRPEEQERTAQLLDLFDVVPVSDAVARKAGELITARRRMGKAWTLDDMLIAASALETGSALYTTNRRDFEAPKVVFYTPEK